MISFEAATKAYGERRVVGPLSFAVSKGEFVALLGPSGCGKTTTLKMVNALVMPDSGLVRVEGDSVDAPSRTRLRRRVGYVFQEVGLFPHMTVEENISVGPRLANWPAERIVERVDALLALIALPKDTRARLPNALSGGQRQRVGLARALAAEPNIMLMDEPFGALDPITRDDLGREYRGLHDSLGLTTIMVTHDVMEALLLGDRIIVLDRGQILADGTPSALLSGHPDPVVQHLMDTPRRQARRLQVLAEGAARG